MIDHEQHKFEAIYACGIVQFRQLFLSIRDTGDKGHIVLLTTICSFESLQKLPQQVVFQTCWAGYWV